MFLHIVLAFVVFFGGFFAIMLTVKLRQVRAASRWPSVPGEIVSARTSSKKVTTHHATYDEQEDRKERRNFARITYRYMVGGKQYVSSRLSLGEDLGNADVQATLERYPKGRVVEVYYDPAAPGKAVLERGLPKGCAKAGLCGVALVIAIIAIFGYGLDYAVIRIAPHIKHPDKASMVVFAATFSLLCTWFALMLWNQGRVARKWPRTQGRIETVEKPDWRTIIIYRYEVNDVPYQSSVVDFGGNKRSVFKLASGITIKGGMPDQIVEVFYDPSDPAKACLYPGTRLIVMPISIALLVGGLAWLLATS